MMFNVGPVSLILFCSFCLILSEYVQLAFQCLLTSGYRVEVHSLWEVKIKKLIPT